MEFTAEERGILRRCATPEKVQRFLDSLAYNFEKGGETLRSFRRVVRDRTAHCLEGVVTAAAILREHGHPPWVLCMEARDIDHNVLLYRTGGRWGAVAQSRDENLKFREPRYRTLWDLVMSYYPHYWNYWTGDRTDLTLRGYARLSLGRFRRDWVTAEEDLFFIEDALYALPYRRLFPRNRRSFYLSTREGKIVEVNAAGRGSTRPRPAGRRPGRSR